jgi:alpha-mannosidase
MPACKLSEDGRSLIVRLFEPTGAERKTILTLPALDLTLPVRLTPFEIKTLRISLDGKRVRETNLLEESLPDPQ